MYLPTLRGLAAGAAALALALGSGPAVADVTQDGDSFQDIDLAGHSLAGECHWAGATTDGGTNAEFYGWATSDATGFTIEIECWLRLADKTRVPGTTMTAFAPGSAVAVQRQITIPNGTLTFTCARVFANYLDRMFKIYRTKNCV